MGGWSISTDMKNQAMELLNDRWTEGETAEELVRSIQRGEDNVAL